MKVDLYSLKMLARYSTFDSDYDTFSFSEDVSQILAGFMEYAK